MHQHGFSLIELLMGLAIVGIVLSLVSPALASLTQSNHREQAAHSLASGIRNTRTAAITHGQAAMIYGIDGDWRQGWRIILDVSGKGYEDSSNPLLFEHRGDARAPIVGNWMVRSFIRFSSLGQPQMPDGAFQGGTLHLCAVHEPVSQVQVVLSPSGRVRLSSNEAEQALCLGGKNLKAKNARAAL